MGENKDLMPTKMYARTLDPIHIGAGGYRLGRVDNTIVRDPATDVPKIPGTAIAGAVKAYADIVKQEDKSKKDGKKKLENIDIKEVFGTENKKGKLRFYDAQIIFFPVSSEKGTVWITTKDLLEYWFEEVRDENGEKLQLPSEPGGEAYAIKGIDDGNYLNLGWLFLKVNKVSTGKKITLPPEIPEKWIQKIVLIPGRLFSHIVNDNLEVRTSVRIDSKTGTAAEGALFTYEAIPRGTVLGFEIGFDKYGDTKAQDVVPDIMNAVLPYFRYLGIGGMGTRGFGRLEVSDKQNSEFSGGVSGA